MQDIQELSKQIMGKIDQFGGKRVMIVGDIGLDEYVLGRVRRISPEAPVPVLEVQEEFQRLGLASNVAQNVVSLGGKICLIAVVGRDFAGQDLRKHLKAAGVSDEYLIEDANRPTTRKTRMMSEMHHLLRVDNEQRKFFDTQMENKILQMAESEMPKTDIVILQDYAKGVLSENVAQKIISIAKKHNKVVVVDPNEKTPATYYRGAQLMTPNRNEALALSALPVDDLREVSADMREVGQALMNAIGSTTMVITRSKDGMSLFENSKIYHVPTFARQVYDVTGAGDTVIAALALAWASGFNLLESCMLANYAAGVVVGKVGCVPCSKAELLDYMASHELS